MSDADVLSRGHRKTWIFAVAFAITALTLFILNVTQQQVFRISVERPTFEQYQHMAVFHPQCPCGNPDTTLAAFTRLNVSASANMSINACSPITQLIDVCGTVGNACTQENAGALLWANYLMTMSSICHTFAGQFAKSIDNTYSESVGVVLLDPLGLQSFAEHAALLNLQVFQAAIGSVYQPVVSLSTVQVMPAFELTYGSSLQTPANCTCHGPDTDHLSPSQQHNNGCHFKAAFDSREGDAFATWSCNNAFDTLCFPLALLAMDSTYALMGIPPPYTQFTNFVGADPSTALIFANFLEQSLATIFFIDESGNTTFIDPSQLRPGFVVTDFAAHYATCQPQECTYVYQDRPGLLTAVTTLLGLISGIQTVLTILIDRGYDYVFKPKSLVNEDDDSDTDEVVGVGVANGSTTSSASRQGAGVELSALATPFIP